MQSLGRGKAGQSCQCCGAQLDVSVARKAWLVFGPTQQCSCAAPSHRSTKRGRSLIGNKQLVHRSHGQLATPTHMSIELWLRRHLAKLGRGLWVLVNAGPAPALQICVHEYQAACSMFAGLPGMLIRPALHSGRLCTLACIACGVGMADAVHH